MFQLDKIKWFIILLTIQNVWCDRYMVDLTSDGPVVLGGTIHFNAHLSANDGTIPSGKFTYSWEDNSMHGNSAIMTLDSPACAWNLTYDAKDYPPGSYRVQVEVAESKWWGMLTITSARLSFHITAMLNGDLKLTQGTTEQSGRYIASGEPVRNEVALRGPDFKFLNDTATNITTMWFLDCEFVSSQPGYVFMNNYTNPEESHLISAIVIAGFEPPPTPPPPTTTTTTTTTTAKPTTTSPATTTTTTVKPTTTSTPKPGRKRRQIIDKPVVSPFMCGNKTLIETNPNKTYGYFSKHVTIREPIQNITISGTNWIQHGDILNLNVNCKGSNPIRYCLIYHNGLRNATGNETCPESPSPLPKCDFNITHLFRDDQLHSIFIILTNDVTKIVKTAGVHIYSTIQHPQISVIVVPVVFSIISVILMVFGAAYYFQCQNRFIVEVADFDFGQQYAEMEYKTFYQRLRESILETFIGTFFIRDDDDEDEGNIQGNEAANIPATNGFRYGSV